MFLFLSKLLPLFLYPIGLSFFLVILSLILYYKKYRFSHLPLIISLSIVWLTGNPWISNYLVQSLEWQYITKTELPTADAIVVLGGVSRSQAYPRPTVDLMEAGDRVIYGGQLYRQQKAPLIILTGGRIDWKGYGVPEALDMREVLIKEGIPENVIITEPEALNTYENAVNVKRILTQRKLKKILLVTSAIHMPRSIKIFKKQQIDVIPAPTDYLISVLELGEPNRTWEGVLLGLIPDVDNIYTTTKAIKEYLGLLIYSLRGWV